VKALEANDARAAVAIAAFKTLYDVEADVKNVSVEERRAARPERSRPVYDELLSWCQTYQPTEPPGSLLGAAIRYLLNHRVALRRSLEDGRLRTSPRSTARTTLTHTSLSTPSCATSRAP
jgi:transposase